MNTAPDLRITGAVSIRPVRPGPVACSVRRWSFADPNSCSPLLPLQLDPFVEKLKPAAIEQRIGAAVSSRIERICRVETGDFGWIKPELSEFVLAAPRSDDAKCVSRAPLGVQLVAAYQFLHDPRPFVLCFLRGSRLGGHADLHLVISVRIRRGLHWRSPAGILSGRRSVTAPPTLPSNVVVNVSSSVKVSSAPS